jgi:hypothetical protein
MIDPTEIKTVGDFLDKIEIWRRDLPISFSTSHGYKLEFWMLAGTGKIDVVFKHEKEETNDPITE